MKAVRYSLLILTVSLLASCARESAVEPSGSGTIEAFDITVSSQSAGLIMEKIVTEGDTVEKGDLLYRIETDKLDAQMTLAETSLDEIGWNEKLTASEIATADESIEQAEIALKDIQRRKERLDRMVNNKAATRDQLDTAETEYRLAQSRLQAAEKKKSTLETRLKSFAAARNKIDAEMKLLTLSIEDAAVISPETGSIIETYRERGEMTAPGTPLCKIADLSTVKLMIYLGETDIGRIKTGQKVTVRIDSYPDRDFEGTVTWISPVAEFTPKNVQTRESRVDLVYAVRVDIANPDGVFKIGMPADAYIEGI